ncbi:MAG TPA: hypothetical protein VL125_09325 [Pelobium sp.]|nr:hypothetical protein [Pelobium sp.]
MDNFPPKPANKKSGFFYFDSKDENLWVSKSDSWFGKTLNFANPLAYIVVLLSLLVIILVTRLV